MIPNPAKTTTTTGDRAISSKDSPAIGEYSTMRTRKSPMLSVRQRASPVSPGCVVAGIWLQSVTVKGRVGIFMEPLS